MSEGPTAMFEPTQLRTFLTAAQTLSFTQAAHRLGLRQSTVSQHVRRLEEAAGCRLFLRDPHGVELTEDGEAMLGFARPILEATSGRPPSSPAPGCAGGCGSGCRR